MSLHENGLGGECPSCELAWEWDCICMCLHVVCVVSLEFAWKTCFGLWK